MQLSIFGACAPILLGPQQFKQKPKRTTAVSGALALLAVAGLGRASAASAAGATCTVDPQSDPACAVTTWDDQRRTGSIRIAGVPLEVVRVIVDPSLGESPLTVSRSFASDRVTKDCKAQIECPGGAVLKCENQR